MIEPRTQSHLAAKAELDQLRHTVARASDSTSSDLPVLESTDVALGNKHHRAWQIAPAPTEPQVSSELPPPSREHDEQRPGFAAFWRAVRHFGPSWLTSAVVHAAILVALGLVAIAAEPGKHVEGLLATFAEGDSPTSDDELATVEMELPKGLPDSEHDEGNLGRGPRATRVGSGPNVGGLLAGAEMGRLNVEASESGALAIGSAAADIAAMIGNGQTLGDIVRPLPGGGGGTEPVVGKGYASFFGLEAKGYRFVYVVDGSGSMYGRRFVAAREQLVSSLAALDEHQSFYVIFFNVTEYPQYFPAPEKTLSPVSPSTLRKVTEWMADFVPNGHTNPIEALSRAMAMAPDAIFLLTDGEFSEELVHTIRRQNYRHTPIHTIAFESMLGERQLYGIAEMTGGTYRYVP